MKADKCLVVGRPFHCLLIIKQYGNDLHLIWKPERERVRRHSRRSATQDARDNGRIEPAKTSAQIAP
jgi:hypothetical protein